MIVDSVRRRHSGIDRVVPGHEGIGQRPKSGGEGESPIRHQTGCWAPFRAIEGTGRQKKDREQSQRSHESATITTPFPECQADKKRAPTPLGVGALQSPQTELLRLLNSLNRINNNNRVAIPAFAIANDNPLNTHILVVMPIQDLFHAFIVAPPYFFCSCLWLCCRLSQKM